MAGSVHFQLLGPVRATVDGRPVPITAQRQLAVLATLLLRPNRTVPVTDLVAAVWDGAPPATAVNQISICVLGLRRALAAAGGGRDLIYTQPPGYFIQAPPGALDLERVEQRLRLADEEQASGRLEAALAHLRAALTAWRGPVLRDLTSAPLRAAAVRWEQRRLAVLDACRALESRLDREVPQTAGAR